MKESTTKEKVLKKIRNALLHNMPSPNLNIDFEKSVFAVSDNPIEIEFVNSFKATEGQFIFCDNEEEVKNNIALIINHLKVNELICGRDNIHQLSPSISLNEEINENSPLIACLSNCEYLIARTGSIMISSQQTATHENLASANILIIIAEINQIVPNIKAAFEQLNLKYKKMPSMINIITGTSKDLYPTYELKNSNYGHQQLFLLLTDTLNN